MRRSQDRDHVPIGVARHLESCSRLPFASLGFAQLGVELGGRQFPRLNGRASKSAEKRRNCRESSVRERSPLFVAHRHRLKPLRRHESLDYFRLVIDHEVRIALYHRERLVPEHVGDFEQRCALRCEH